MKATKKNFWQDHSPLYRALLKAGEATFWIVILNGIVAVGYYLPTHQVIDWVELGKYAAAMSGLGLALSLSKYFKASRQPALGQAIDQAVAEIQKRRPDLRPRLPEDAEASIHLEQRNWRPTGDDWSKRRPQEGG